jgi:hypothetical protein
MSGIILCIDDQPVRYHSFRDSILKINPNIFTVVTCRPDEFFWYITGPYKILGICLDHDMPYKEGTFFAEQLGEFNYPVAIVSQNPSGVVMIQAILDEWGVPNKITNCAWKNWESLAIDFFNIKKEEKVLQIE